MVQDFEPVNPQRLNILNKGGDKVQDTDRGARIQEERKRLDLTIVALAQATGVSKGSQILYEKGSPPTADYLSALLNLGADIHYILAGKRAQRISEMVGQHVLIELAAAKGQLLEQVPSPGPAAASSKALSVNDFEPIPLHEAVLAAGTGATNSSEAIVAHLAFRRDWLSRIGVSTENGRLARVAGESMTPTISAGDMLLINTAQVDLPIRVRHSRDTRPAPVYAFLEQGEARVKRIERPSEDQLLLSSDNPSYGSELRPISEITIIGKVVWWGHTVRE